MAKYIYEYKNWTDFTWENAVIHSIFGEVRWTRLLTLEHPLNFWNMKTKIEKKFDTVAFFKAIKEKLALKMAGMTLEEQKVFMQKVRDGKIEIA